MKLYGLFGKGSGKVGSSVFAISGGEQIVREYNPVVSNPNTAAQVEQRAKFKLLTQVAAALSSVIVFTKKGLVSARNQFIAKNIKAANYENGTATINVQRLDLTGGAIPMPYPRVRRAEGQDAVFELDAAAPDNVDAVMYVIAEATGDQKIKVAKTALVEAPGDARKFQISIPGAPTPGVVLAYGIIGDVKAALADYGDYTYTAADIIASLVATRSTKVANLGFTATSGEEI